MVDIQLNIEDLKKTFLRKTTFFNTTGKKYKAFPFRTSGADKCYRDFQTFNGIVGGCIRINENIDFSKEFKGSKEASFDFKLKSYILDEALKKTETTDTDEFRNVLVKLFFKENHELIKFNNSVIKYLSNFQDHPGLEEFSKMFSDIFIDSQKIHDVINEEDQKDNLFYQLIQESLPKLNVNSNQNVETKYSDSIPEITQLFKKDSEFLTSHSNVFLEHIEDLFKFYYFFYVTQLANQFDRLNKSREVHPFYYALEWENFSQSRASYIAGWRSMSTRIKGVFPQAITLELLNHIKLNNESIGDFISFYSLEKELDKIDLKNLNSKIDELIIFYKDYNSDTLSGENLIELENRLNDYVPNKGSLLDQKINTLMTTIKFVLEKSGRDAAADRFANWIVEFAKANFLKWRGRSGYTTKITQEMLLFLVKLSIGNNDRIRLKDLWLELKKRGVLFDELSKSEIVTLFEKINLLEKKSDSGDAQYVKSFI